MDIHLSAPAKVNLFLRVLARRPDGYHELLTLMQPISLADDLDGPLRLGIGIHRGPVIVGEMGWGRTTSLTAIGDVVNTASRLETATKEFRAELVVSDEVADLADLDLGEVRRREVMMRGREAPLAVRVVASARRISIRK